MNKTSIPPYLIILFLLWNPTLAQATENEPTCLAGVTFMLDDVAKEVTVNASDLLQDVAGESEVDESLQLRIWHPKFTIDKPQADAAAKTILDLPSSVTFDCAEIGIQLVELYAIDADGNWGFCLSNIDIQAANTTCNTTIETSNTERIAGRISTITGIPLEKVALKFSTTDTEKASVFTDSAGYFEMKMPENKDFVVHLEKEGDIINGISTFDIVLLAKHIINAAPFTVPYQYIAADVNRSGTVTAFDMVELRRVILGLQTERFPNNTSWRFITKEDYYASSNPLEGAFTENILLTDLDNPIGDLSFFAIKIGDVNASADINGLVGAEARKEVGGIQITTADRLVKIGETFELPFFSKGLKDLQSLQFSLFCKGLKVVAIEEGILKANHFAGTGTNRVGISWDAIFTTPVPEKEEVLFTLQLKALENGQLSQLLSLSDELVAEVVNQKEELLNLELNFIKDSSFELFQNEPNPFDYETTIGFTLPEYGPVSLEIFNLNGKLVKEIHGNFDKGYNEISINRQTLMDNGTFIYQLRTDQGIRTKKMIAIKE